MATSKFNSSDGQVANKTSATKNYIEKTKSELEEMFGLLYFHGIPRDMNETERQQLMGLAENLEDIKSSIDQFQKDLSKVCGIDSRSSAQKLDVERRDVKGRLRVGHDPDSGYTSKFISKVYGTLSQTFGRLSQADKDDNQATSGEETELFNPSISVISSENTIHHPSIEVRTNPDTNVCGTEKRPWFYTQTPDASSASLNDMDSKTDKLETPVLKPHTGQESTTNPTDEGHVPKQPNDLSKPPSEEDNTKYSTESSPTTC